MSVPQLPGLPLPLPGVPLPLPGAPGGGVGGIVGDVADAGAAAVFDSFGHWVAGGTADLLGTLVGVLDRVTRPDVTAGWYSGQYARMAAAAGFLVLPLLLAAVLTAVLRRDLSGLARAVGLQLPLAALGTAVAAQVVNLALAATDGLCAVVTAGTGADAAALFGRIRTGLDGLSGGTGSFAVLVVSIVVAAAALLLALELIVRTAAVYVAVLFLPMAFAGLVWPSTARWGRRLAETLSVLILSKFVVVAVIAMAVAALGAGVAGDGLSGLLTGTALLALAAAAPFALLRMVPIVEAGMIGHLEGAGRRSVSSAAAGARADVLRPLLAGLGAGAPPSGPPVAGPAQPLAMAVPDRGLGPDGSQLLTATPPLPGRTAPHQEPAAAQAAPPPGAPRPPGTTADG